MFPTDAEAQKQTFSEQKIEEQVSINTTKHTQYEKLIKSESYTDSIAVIFDEGITHKAQFTNADVLSGHNSHPIVMYYYGSITSPFHDLLRANYSHLSMKSPKKYKFQIENRKLNDKNNVNNSNDIRHPILSYLRKKKPKFVVLGIQKGLSSSILGSENDISFRECLCATPIIVKEDQVRKKIENEDGKKEYSSSNWAFQIDFTNEAMFAFELMLPSLKTGDCVHLLYVKPSAKLTFFSNDSKSLELIFKPFHNLIAKLNMKKIMVEDHVFTKPNIGQALSGFVNTKKNNIHFIVVYCDLMQQSFHGNDKLIGSVSDHCVRFCNCPVIVPKLPVD